MPSWLVDEAAISSLAWDSMAWRLALAALFGFIVATVHAASQGKSENAIPLYTTLVLLTVLVAMTTIVIGDSVARAFGLVGALSIVRFRTVVDDTRDTAFVIFAVVVGMALGAGNMLSCLIGVPIVSAAAIILSHSGILVARGNEKKLEVRIGTGHDPERLFAEVFRQHLASVRLASVISARQGAALDLIYVVRLREPSAVFAAVKAIHALEGVQSVEMKDA